MGDKCFFLVSIAGEKPRKIVFELATNICPKTCHNFISFCTSRDPFKSYRNTQFHRVIPGFMIQGGDYQNGDGTGGESFEGGNLLDESFDLSHDAAGVLSMANRGKNTAGSQFFITLDKAPHLDGKHVVFGHVVKGMDVVYDIAKVETDQNDRPVSLQKVSVVECGIDGAETDEFLSSDESDKKKQKSVKKHSKRKKSKRRDRRYSSDEYTSESDDQDDDSDERGRKRDRERRLKKSSRRRRHSRKKSRRNYSDSDDSCSSEESRKRRKKRKEKHRYYSSEESSDYSNKRRKRKHSHKSKKKKRRKEHSEDTKEMKPALTANAFGMYGIIRDTDFMTSSKVKRSFERWMEEVKGVPQGANIPKWEVTNYMKEYAEDFNTATLPHIKYYDYDKWEMEEYNKRKEESKRKKGALSDEIEYQEEMKKKAEEKRRREFEMVKTMMSKDRIDEMKKQSRLRAELQNAYRVGDEATRKRLQKRLEPESK